MNLEQKTAGTIESLQRTTKGGGCGIVGIGCGIIVVIFLTLCVGSYFLTMHSSMPLAMIENALEADGSVQVEGLKGTISRGFEIESLKFESDECDEWNELRDLRFSYNGFFNLLRTRRLIISEGSIGSATIYANIDGNNEAEREVKINGEDVAKDISEGWAEVQDDITNQDSDDLKEFRIDLLSANNIAIVDPNSGTTLKFDKVEFRDFQMMDSQVKRLGELEVKSNQLDLKTEKSKRFADEPVSWNLTGTVKSAIHNTLIDNIPFDIDFAIQARDKFRLHVNLFDGQVEIEEPYGDERKFRMTDFSPSEFFDMESDLVPTRWNVGMTIVSSTIDVEKPREEKDNSEQQDEQQGEQENEQPQKIKAKVHTLEIQPGATFMLGETQFEVQTERIVFGPFEKMEPGRIRAQGKMNDTSVIALITLRGNAPWFAVELDSNVPGTAAEDLWSHLFFEKPHSALTEDQQKQVAKAIVAPCPLGAIQEFEPVDF